jgi:hypothetical protein
MWRFFTRYVEITSPGVIALIAQQGGQLVLLLPHLMLPHRGG